MSAGTINLDPALPLSDAVNAALQPFLGKFSASTVSIADQTGAVVGPYASAIHAGKSDGQTIAANAVATVIICDEELTIESLQSAYQRIQQVKSLSKAKDADPLINREMTVGLIVARNSNFALDRISDEMGRLNRTVPSQYWPDAVAVLSKGFINYTTQVPGGSSQSGDFFLPAPGLVGNGPVPSLLISRTIRPTADQTFNKIVSMTVARAAIYQPDAGVADYRDFLANISPHGVVTDTYQFNLNNVLQPMTTEQVVQAQIPVDWFNVLKGKEILGSVQFREWQDGGIFLVRGKFPIEMFLVFLRVILPGIGVRSLQAFRGTDYQVSFVLPIKRAEFLQTLSVFEQRSNMRVDRQEPKFVVQKFADEGTTNPFVARLMLGVLQVRESVYKQPNENDRFDELYDPVITGLRNARDARRDIEKCWEDHRAKVAAGIIARIERGSIHIEGSIDRTLKKELEGFLNTSVRIVKHLMQTLAAHHGIDIGFLFQRQAPFEAGMAKLKLTDAVLSSYLQATRLWSEPLVLMRNNLEHSTPPSLKVSYVNENGSVAAKEPIIGTEPVTEFVKNRLDRVLCFVEELTMYCLQKKLPTGLTLTERPLAERDESVPLRFQLTVASGGLQPWTLSAHTRKFDLA